MFEAFEPSAVLMLNLLRQLKKNPSVERTLLAEI